MCANNDFPSNENVSWLPIPDGYHDDDHDDDELMMMIMVMVVLNVRNVMSGTNYLTVPPDGSDDLLNRSPLMGRTTN